MTPFTVVCCDRALEMSCVVCAGVSRSRMNSADAASFATVVFRNGLDQGDLEITLERQIGACQGCSTLLRFRQEGAVAVARSLPPQSVATICFHEPGVFAFVARSSAGEQRGRVLVGGGK